MNHRKWIAFLTILTVLGFGWGFYQVAQVQTARTMIQNDRERAFYDLLGAVENMSVLSDKALVATSAGQISRIFSQLNTQAYVAQESMSLLPVNQSAFSRTEQFLNQMGDFSHSLLVQASQGETFNDEQKTTLSQLNTEIANISASLHDLATSEESPFTWTAMQNAGVDEVTDEEKAGIANASFSEIDENLQKIPKLNYDGPFSDHMESRDPVELPGEETSWDKAKQVAASLLGDTYTYKEYGQSGEGAAIPVLTLEVAPKDNPDNVFYLDITKKGAFPALMTNGAAGSESKISQQDALVKAKAFFDKTPYADMVPNYSMIEDNVMTINYVYQQDDTLIYPDMVKISIDMSNGEIVGFDAQSYLINHTTRDFSGLKISEEEAKTKLPANLSLQSAKKAVIPLDNGDEALCYEFRMKSGDKDYLVYINAITGEEQQIMGIYHAPNGTFTL